MALNFSSHWRSAREESAEKPPSTGSSALMKRFAKKRIELATMARIKTRRVVTGTLSPWSEQVFCTKLQNCKRAGASNLDRVFAREDSWCVRGPVAQMSENSGRRR